MKTLANCSDVEFLKQTNKIRKYAETWLKDTGVLDIRKRELPTPEEDMPDDKKREFYRANAKERLDDMLDAVLEDHAEETARLLRMLCFIDPDDTETLKMPQLLKAATDMLENQETLDFFTSLGRLGLMNT